MSGPPAHRGHCFAYYCSGHGYGHATRVSAFARHLLSLEPQPIVNIVSSAAKNVFADSIAQGALYRYADIDPVIVQPLAYRVDRQKSVDVLQSFLRKKDRKVIEESQWLTEIGVDCVLSDAAFLGCLAANAAGIPSVLITNFSFDSVYSYLSTSFIDKASPRPDDIDVQQLQAQIILPPDVPMAADALKPLVDEIFLGFRCADLLLRLPGAIPIPSFTVHPDLPSPSWVDNILQRFAPEVVEHLLGSPTSYNLHPSVEFPAPYGPKPIPRIALPAPLLVRSPNPSVYTPAGRRKLLNSIGVPPYLQDPDTTKILIVSFGGQVFRKPQSRIHSRSPSRAGTPGPFASAASRPVNGLPSRVGTPGPLVLPTSKSINGFPREAPLPKPSDLSKEYFPDPDLLSVALRSMNLSSSMSQPPSSPGLPPPRVITRARGKSQLAIPGAPPVIMTTSPVVNKSPPPAQAPTFNRIPASPVTKQRLVSGRSDDVSEQLVPEAEDGFEEEEPRLLPDETWIAIVCGVSKEWAREDGEELPGNFYVAPRDVYMPDLTAVADVLLGKLGYGTVSECVDACTPFVYVPRPLFIEEHGLRLLLDTGGVGVELSRTSYETGEWADAIEEAYQKGAGAKARKRQEGETGKRKQEGLEMARGLVNWVDRWKAGVMAEMAIVENQLQ